jgi:hypothetical protein
MEAHRQPAVVDFKSRVVRPAKSHRTARLFWSSIANGFAFTTAFFAASLTACGGTALATAPADFEAGDSNVKTLLPGDFRLQPLEQRTGEFLNAATLEARQMHMVHVGFGFVEVFLPVQMHQIQLINQPHFLEKVNRSVHGCPVNLPVTLPCQRQQRGGVQVAIRLLDRFDQDFPLPGNADATERQFLEQRATIQRLWLHRATSCD